MSIDKLKKQRDIARAEAARHRHNYDLTAARCARLTIAIADWQCRWHEQALVVTRLQADLAQQTERAVKAEAINAERLTDQRVLGHGEGQLHALQDVARIIEKHFGPIEPRIDFIETWIGNTWRAGVAVQNERARREVEQNNEIAAQQELAALRSRVLEIADYFVESDKEHHGGEVTHEIAGAVENLRRAALRPAEECKPTCGKCGGAQASPVGECSNAWHNEEFHPKPDTAPPDEPEGATEHDGEAANMSDDAQHGETGLRRGGGLPVFGSDGNGLRAEGLGPLPRGTSPGLRADGEGAQGTGRDRVSVAFDPASAHRRLDHAFMQIGALQKRTDGMEALARADAEYILGSNAENRDVLHAARNEALRHFLPPTAKPNWLCGDPHPQQGKPGGTDLEPPTECRIYEHDGAFKCYAHNRAWGAIPKPDEPCQGWEPTPQPPMGNAGPDGLRALIDEARKIAFAIARKTDTHGTCGFLESAAIAADEGKRDDVARCIEKAIGSAQAAGLWQNYAAEGQPLRPLAQKLTRLREMLGGAK